MSDDEQKVYVVSAEVRALHGSEMWGAAVGGFVFCYANAADARDAICRVERALATDCYAIVAFEWAMPFALSSWDEGDVEEQRQCADAVAGNEVVYSSFDTYESEHEH